MLTVEQFLQEAQNTTPVVAQGSTQPQIVYVPQRSSGGGWGWLIWLVIVGLVVFVVASGGITVKQFAGVTTIGQPVATSRPLPTVAQPNSQVVPTAYVAVPPAPQADVIVVPQGQPVLPAQPTAVPTVIPAVTALPKEWYQPPTPVLAAGAPAIGPAECNSQNSAYRGEKDVTYLRDASNPASAIPLGHIAAWSCESQDAVVAELQQRETDMVAKWKAQHPS